MSSDSSSSPPPNKIDVQWHHQALQKVAPTNQKLKAEAEGAVNNVAQSLRSPLHVDDPPSCNDQHKALVECMEAIKASIDNSASSASSTTTSSSSIASQIELNSLFRQRLALAVDANSKRHALMVESEMCAKLPDRMPQSRLGMMMSPVCYAKMTTFRKCVDERVDDWYQHLNSMHTKSQQQQQHHQQ